jgi:hypothetical protein
MAPKFVLLLQVKLRTIKAENREPKDVITVEE